MKRLLVLTSAVVMVLAHHEHGHQHQRNHNEPRSQPAQYRAIAKLAQPSGEQDIYGNVTFTQLPEGKVHIQGVLVGLAPGHYGFHVHEKGDISGGCGSTGSHYNPHHKDHGHPNDENRHVGDLGNVVFDENHVSVLDYVDSVISLTGEYSILGRAVVLHEKSDDFGRSSHPDSKKTGNAGGRVACGVIGILDPVTGWKGNGATTLRESLYLILPIIMSVFFKYV